MENINWIVSSISALVSIIVSVLASLVCLTKKLTQLEVLNDDFKAAQKELKRVSDDLIRLQTRMDICVPLEKPNALARAHSPIALTPEGEKVKKQIKAEELLQNHQEALYGFVNQAKMNNAYDIQLEAFRVISEKFYAMLSASEMIDIKNEAYNLGKPLEDLLIIFQILFRDYLLKKHGMLVADVDKHNPNAKH